MEEIMQRRSNVETNGGKNVEAKRNRCKKKRKAIGRELPLT